MNYELLKSRTWKLSWDVIDLQDMEKLIIHRVIKFITSLFYSFKRNKRRVKISVNQYKMCSFVKFEFLLILYYYTILITIQ